ncbi:MAG TPA: ECF-type sigma factor [Planctomycetota bacterium]
MPTTTEEDEEIARLLRQSRAGDEPAGRVLFERFYRELRAMAQQQLARERCGHTLAPTSLVHEVFVRLHGTHLAAGDREQFLRLAATVMRNVLIDSARRRQLRNRVEASASGAGAGASRHDPILRLEGAMQRLIALDAQLFRVVELRFLVGLDVEETARVLGCGSATVKRDWRTARAFLQREVERDER